MFIYWPPFRTNSPEFSPSVISAILVTAVFATTMAFLLQNAMQKYSTPTALQSY
ncbi:MAG: hypothetical protein ACOX0N_02125 [Syntrophomonadaceae bacterium]